MRITWQTHTPRIGPSVQYCYVNKFNVGNVSYSLKSKTEPVAYSFRCDLPGISKAVSIGEKSTEEEAKKMVENIVEIWFKKALAE